MTTTQTRDERIAQYAAKRVERLLPKARELLEKHAPPTQAHAWLITEAMLAAILDDVIQELRRQHDSDMHDADREARDAFSQGKYEGEQEARGNDYGSY